MKILRAFKNKFRTFWDNRKKFFPLLFLAVLCIFLLVARWEYRREQNIKRQAASLRDEKTGIEKKLKLSEEELNALKSQDQYLINKTLNEEIKNIHLTYQKAVISYQELLDLKGGSTKTAKLDELFALALKYLSEKNYSLADSTLGDLNKLTEEEKNKSLAVLSPSVNVTVNNSPPGSGYQRQQVQTDSGAFTVDIVSADLNSTRVVVDTASESDCFDNCPVLSLADYVSRNGAFAGVNGSYFCPSTYPQCADKKNSFDTLLMNKNKRYFNSDNNVYSVVPAVIFSGNSARFVGKSLEWGRDTSVDAVIANQPLLVLNNTIVFGGDGDAKQSSKGGRSFVGATGNTVYIGVVRNATVAESAKVLHTMGIHNALNLDDGGSTALWSSGYKVGPGRNLPNVVLLINK